MIFYFFSNSNGLIEFYEQNLIKINDIPNVINQNINNNEENSNSDTIRNDSPMDMTIDVTDDNTRIEFDLNTFKNTRKYLQMKNFKRKCFLKAERMRYFVDLDKDIRFKSVLRPCITEVSKGAISRIQWNEANLITRHYLNVFKKYNKSIFNTLYFRRRGQKFICFKPILLRTILQINKIIMKIILKLLPIQVLIKENAIF